MMSLPRVEMMIGGFRTDATVGHPRHTHRSRPTRSFTDRRERFGNTTQPGTVAPQPDAKSDGPQRRHPVEAVADGAAIALSW
jgi:hypothetical protein